MEGKVVICRLLDIDNTQLNKISVPIYTQLNEYIISRSLRISSSRTYVSSSQMSFCIIMPRKLLFQHAGISASGNPEGFLILQLKGKVIAFSSWWRGLGQQSSKNTGI
jgi:hypothetical protein